MFSTCSNYDVDEAASQINPTGVWIFEIDDTDPNTLHYRSRIFFNDDSILNVFTLNSTNSKIMVIRDSSIETYSFNASTKEFDYASTVSSTDFDEICMDSQGRVFISIGSDLKIYSVDIPVSIVITPEEERYTYTGTNINSYIDVDAYNHLGDRISVDVNVKLIGSNVTFSDGSIEKTVTTSDSSSTRVDIILTGAAFIKVAASIVA